MAFSYTGALDTDLERVRLLIGDTVAASALFQDAEIEYFLGQHGEAHLAAAAACRAVAASKSKLAQRLKEGDYERDLGGMVKQWLQLADQLEKQGRSSAAQATFVSRIDGYSRGSAHDRR
jgi:hypothetical protein